MYMRMAGEEEMRDVGGRLSGRKMVIANERTMLTCIACNRGSFFFFFLSRKKYNLMAGDWVSGLGGFGIGVYGNGLSSPFFVFFLFPFRILHLSFFIHILPYLLPICLPAKLSTYLRIYKSKEIL